MRSFHAAYRLQINALWRFSHATAIIPYLAELGIDALYLSPILTAKRGSTHCYDMTNPLEINPELGGEEGYRVLVKMAHMYNMCIIVDVVANHMAASIENPWWRDVLENGGNSQYSTFFDIDWKPPHKELQGKILVPYLPMPFHEVLKDGGIRLNLREEGICIEAGFHRLPCNPELYSRIFQRSRLDRALYKELLAVFSKVTKATTEDEKKERAFHIHKGKAILARMVVEHSREVIETLGEINSDKHLLEEFLEDQHYRLEYWQTGFQYINYRRFFDINELIALKAEEPHVFDVCHKKLFALCDEGLIDGIRVDHPDGLKDPKRYFQKLREGGCNYLIVEKILEKDEPLRKDWNVEGTVGYEYLNALFGLFVQPKGEAALTRIYEGFIGEKRNPIQLLYKNKREYATKYMSAEIAALAQKYTPPGVSKEEFVLALIDFFAIFPVYRTYFTEKESSQLDRLYMQDAFYDYAKNKDTIRKPVIDFLQKVFLEGHHPREFLYRFQQLSPPIMAKGLEDTHLYQYNRLISLNEVGGSPHEFAYTADHFHAQNSEAAVHFPMRFTTANTHDTKRSDELRLRISFLSECPDEWDLIVRKLSDAAKMYKIGPYPDKNFEYLIYQTLLGIMPEEGKRAPHLKERLSAYVIKAARESKEYTNWINHDSNYEQALTQFIDALFEHFKTPFWDIFFPFIGKCAYAARKMRISSLLLRLGSPGIFEIYQGTEVPFFALVDPDNRRSIHFEKHQQMLQQVKKMTGIPKEEDLEKLSYLYRFLAWRKEHASLFIQGKYLPLAIQGEGYIGFVRKNREMTCLILAKHLFFAHEEAIVHLPSEIGEKKWRDLFSKRVYSLGNSFSAKEVLHDKPATVLHTYEN